MGRWGNRQVRFKGSALEASLKGGEKEKVREGWRRTFRLVSGGSLDGGLQEETIQKWCQLYRHVRECLAGISRLTVSGTPGRGNLVANSTTSFFRAANCCEASPFPE